MSQDPPGIVRNPTWEHAAIAARLSAHWGAVEPDDGGSGYAIASADAHCKSDARGEPSEPIPAGLFTRLRDAIRAEGHKPVR